MKYVFWESMHKIEETVYKMSQTFLLKRLGHTLTGL